MGLSPHRGCALEPHPARGARCGALGRPEDGGRLERCNDGDDRRVKLPTVTPAVLRAHLEAMDLEGGVNRWTPEQSRARVPEHCRSDHPVRGFLRAGLEAAADRGQAPLQRVPQHDAQLHDLNARGRRRPPAVISSGSATRVGVNLDAVLGEVHSRPSACTLFGAGGVSEGQYAMFRARKSWWRVRGSFTA